MRLNCAFCPTVPCLRDCFVQQQEGGQLNVVRGGITSISPLLSSTVHLSISPALGTLLWSGALHCCTFSGFFPRDQSMPIGNERDPEVAFSNLSPFFQDILYSRVF